MNFWIRFPLIFSTFVSKEKHVSLQNLRQEIQEPMKLFCSPQKLGERNPISLFFEGCIEGLETDDLFSECTQIRRLYIGKHEKALLSQIQYLNLENLEYVGINGDCLCSLSDEFKNRIQENCLSALKYVYLILKLRTGILSDNP
jgi:hypothetical protein